MVRVRSLDGPLLVASDAFLRRKRFRLGVAFMRFDWWLHRLGFGR